MSVEDAWRVADPPDIFDVDATCLTSLLQLASFVEHTFLQVTHYSSSGILNKEKLTLP